MVAVNENSTYAAHNGKSLGEIARAVNQDPWDVFTIRDRATFSQPDAISEGMKFVIVNGGIVIEDGKYNGATPGKVLRGPGYRAGKLK